MFRVNYSGIATRYSSRNGKYLTSFTSKDKESAAIFDLRKPYARYVGSVKEGRSVFIGKYAEANLGIEIYYTRPWYPMRIYVAGWLLSIANCDPPHSIRKEFYSLLKLPLLTRWGYTSGSVLQEIVHECWECNGSGIDPFSTGYMGTDEECFKCRGSGAYTTIYILHQRYELCGRNYLSPMERLPVKPENKEIGLKGLATHSSNGPACTEATLWLALLMGELRLLLMIRFTDLTPRIRFPLQLTLWLIKKTSKKWFSRFKCEYCNRWAFMTWRVGRSACRVCRKCMIDYNETPF